MTSTTFRSLPAQVSGGCGDTDALLRYGTRPLRFLLRYVRRRALAHGVVLGSVLAAVACSVGTNYALKALIDALSGGPGVAVWAAFSVLAAVVAADNLLWRVGGWVAAGTYPAVTTDIRADLFRHLGGHAPAFFAGRPAGVLASRVTATANAAYTMLHNFTWHTLPPACGRAGAARSPSPRAWPATSRRRGTAVRSSTRREDAAAPRRCRT